MYEEGKEHFTSIAIARPEWGEFPEEWNMEFIDSDINGYSLQITYYESEGSYKVLYLLLRGDRILNADKR